MLRNQCKLEKSIGDDQCLRDYVWWRGYWSPGEKMLEAKEAEEIQLMMRRRGFEYHFFLNGLVIVIIIIIMSTDWYAGRNYYVIIMSSSWDKIQQDCVEHISWGNNKKQSMWHKQSRNIKIPGFLLYLFCWEGSLSTEKEILWFLNRITIIITSRLSLWHDAAQAWDHLVLAQVSQDQEIRFLDDDLDNKNPLFRPFTSASKTW